MADPAAYPGCVGQGMNFAEHPYEGRGPGHCQSGGGGYPYPGQYRPHPSSPPASYGPPPGQHCGGSYGNGPMPSSPGPYPRQPYPGAVPEMRYGPRHSAPPAYQGSPAPLSKPPGTWDHSMGGGGNYGTRPVMMQSPPPIRSPVSSAPTMHTMGNYRTVVPPGPAGPPMGVAPPPPHGNVPVPQSQSPSWSQSPRTTPSPLACHARSPAPSQQPPFSPPTPAPTPQLQKPPSPITGSHDPLQSLEKMVLLDPHNSSSGGSASYGGMQESSGYGSTSGGGTESGPSSPYPTYYNLDQNRMCTPPDPGPPYGIANFAATGAYRTVLPNMDSNAALRGDRTSSGGIPAPPPGVYPQPVVNGVNDGDFGTGGSPMAGPPPRSGDFDRPYASAGPRGGSPSCDDSMKRRRSSDSVLCNRPSSVGPPGPSGAMSTSSAMDGGCKLRRRSVAGVPDKMNMSPAPLTAVSSEQSPAQRVKTEPEVSVSEPERVQVSDVVSVSGVSAATATTTTAVASASSTSTSSASTAQQATPTKRKRGRPFGAKNKVKDGGAVVKRRRRKAVTPAHPVAAATPAAAVTTAATTTKVRTPTTGPYVRVLGTRERPLSSHIVNMTPRTVPEDESKRKKVSAPPTRAAPQHATGRRLAGSAAHTSTLSPHYDAVTRDPTWLCAFCLKGSHHQGLGDLYGPYPGTMVRPAEPEPASCQEETLRRGRATKRKKSDSFSGTEDGSTPRRGSRQRRSSEAEREAEVSKELWVHETCATWSQGVYLGGNRVHGLQEAVAEATHLVCCKCKLVGASLGCLSRGCSEKYHYLCAVEKGCQLDTENFSILCPKHKKPSTRPS